MQEEQNIPEEVKDWIIQEGDRCSLNEGERLFFRKGCYAMYNKMSSINDDEKDDLQNQIDLLQQEALRFIEAADIYNGEITRLKSDNGLLHMQIDGLKESNENYALENAALQKQVREYREALDEITNPIKYMQKAAEKEDCNMDGQLAIQISKNPNYLKKIAQNILNKYPQP